MESTTNLNSSIPESEINLSKAVIEDSMQTPRLEVLPLATFKPFTKLSYVRLCEREEQLKKLELERAKHAQDAHLVAGGQLKFGSKKDDGETLPPENPDLKEGCLLTKAYGRFPTRFYGKPVEEIDIGIREKVSSSFSFN